ncbi:MAG: hypothetical protein ABSE69_19595, partial [Roseiarcus sp.]
GADWSQQSNHTLNQLFKPHPPAWAALSRLAYALVKLGAEHLAEELAARKLASAVGKLVRNEAANPFVVSRLAVALRHALNEPAAKSRLGAACYSAGVQEVFYSLNEIVDQAVNRDGKACRSLVDICKALRPHLPDPRGRRPDLAGATHELLLHIQNRAYTYHAYSEDMTDGATRATRAAMNNQDFDPRPAWRRLKKTRRSQSAEGHRIPAPGFAR